MIIISKPRRALLHGVAVALLSMLLSGCEAPLTMDGVATAQRQAIHRTDRYQAAARNGAQVVVVGNQGVIVHSADAGETWSRTELPTWPDLIDVAACPDGVFVALAFAPRIFISTDGGSNWESRAIPTEESPQAITCTVDNKIWVVGAFTYRWSSTDRGLSWDEATNDEDAIFTSIQFIDKDNGVIAGEFGTVMTTKDGGQTWESLPPLDDEFYPQTAYFRDMERGWIGGLGGVILHTEDGGQTWREQDTDTVVPIYNITAVGDNLFAVGGEGTVLRYDGSKWHLFEHGLPLRLYVRAMATLSDERLLIAGVGGALHIVDLSGA